jgi:hypothetical protein
MPRQLSKAVRNGGHGLPQDANSNEEAFLEPAPQRRLEHHPKSCCGTYLGFFLSATPPEGTMIYTLLQPSEAI